MWIVIERLLFTKILSKTSKLEIFLKNLIFLSIANFTRIKFSKFLYQIRRFNRSQVSDNPSLIYLFIILISSQIFLHRSSHYFFTLNELINQVQSSLMSCFNYYDMKQLCKAAELVNKIFCAEFTFLLILISKTAEI